jgi:hypothetical protein
MTYYIALTRSNKKYESKKKINKKIHNLIKQK